MFVGLEAIKARREALDSLMLMDRGTHVSQKEILRQRQVSGSFWDNIYDDEAALIQEVERLRGELDRFQSCIVSTNSKWRSLGETCDEEHYHKG